MDMQSIGRSGPMGIDDNGHANCYGLLLPLQPPFRRRFSASIPDF